MSTKVTLFTFSITPKKNMVMYDATTSVKYLQSFLLLSSVIRKE